jgi:hypothetical protein
VTQNHQATRFLEVTTMRGTALPLLFGALILAGAARGQDLPLQPYSYVEGFETGTPKLELWASNGSPPEVHFNGVTDEQAAEGKRCLKLDVTLGDGSYYYFGLPLRVPCAGELVLTAKVAVAPGSTASVGFGTNMIYPPSQHSGCRPFYSFDKPNGEWQTVSADLVRTGRDGAAGVMSGYTATLKGQDVGVFLDRWALFLTGSKGQRATVYIDDLRVTGRVPDVKQYEASVQAAFDKATAPFRKQVKAWRGDLENARRSAGSLNQAPAEVADLVAGARAADKQADELLAQMDRDGYAANAQLSSLQAALAAVRYGPETVRAANEAIHDKRPLLVYACGNAVSRPRQAGLGELLGAQVGGMLSCSGCRGEYESRSAVVLALRDLKGLKVTASALTGPAGRIPAAAVDVRLVKWWYQGASGGISYSPRKALMAELLLKDDALVRVDTGKQDNYLRSTRPDGSTEYLICSNPDSSNLANVRPVDAKALQPVDMPAGTSREFWINLRVPPNAAAGTYTGRLSFTAGEVSADLPVRMTVNNFDLEPSRITYSIYYRAQLAPDGQPTIGSELKSEEQYRAEIADMRDHGVLYPANYQDWGEPRLRRALEIRKEEGLPGGRFYNLGYSVPPEDSPAALAEIGATVKRWQEFLKPYGYDQVYFYGMDEATGEQLASQKAAWQAAQQAGAKTFVACYQGTFEAMGKLLNCAVIAGAPDTEEVRKWHSVGSEIFCYANPQVGVEDPMLYRRNFGLRLWAAGYDGAMDYAYQHGFGHVWNDFDDKTYRDHNFTYPTVNGVVDTIEWEGFREAVDDLRYMTTLECVIAQATPSKPVLVAQARAWVQQPDLASQDLDEVRVQMATWITKLEGPTPYVPPGGG